MKLSSLGLGFSEAFFNSTLPYFFEDLNDFKYKFSTYKVKTYVTSAFRNFLDFLHPSRQARPEKLVHLIFETFLNLLYRIFGQQSTTFVAKIV